MTETAVASGVAEVKQKDPNKLFPLLVIAGAQLMIVLDATIVNIAMPTMGTYFHKSQTDMTWAINAYTLAFGGLLLLGGKAGDIFGRKRMFIIGLSLFSLGSLLGGFATNFETLIIGRVIQGVGGAISSPTALALITTEFEEGKERTRAFAVFSAVAGAGASVGLLLGGILTEIDWRWVLFVNVPIGALLVTGAFTYLHESARHPGRFDWFGGLSSTVGMTSLVYGFISAARNGWAEPQTIGAFVLAGVMLAIFIALEARLPYAMMPLRIFRNKTRSGGYIVMATVGAGMFGMFFFVTFFVQQVLHYSALKTGLSFLPVSFAIAIAAQLSARNLHKFGPRNLIMAGTSLAAIGLFWLSALSPDSGYWTHLFPSLVTMALGIGTLFVPLMTLAVAGADPQEAGMASALLNVSQQVGGSIGLSVLTTVFATAATNKAKDLAGHTGLSPRDVADQILTHGASLGFIAAGLFAVIGLIVTITMIKAGKDDVAALPGMPGH